MFTHDPGKDVISGYRENMDGKKLENRILMIFIHDRNTDKLVRKDIYSYGFIVNQVGEEREGRFVFDSVSMDGELDYFKGIRFRTFIEKHSKERMTMGVEVAEKGREFHLYVQQKFRRVNDVAVTYLERTWKSGFWQLRCRPRLSRHSASRPGSHRRSGST